MPRVWKIAFGLAVALGASSVTFVDPFVQSVLNQWASEQLGPVGAIVADKNGVTGSASANYGPVPTASTVFEIGSLTKTFTALAIQLLEDQGKLAMTDTLRQHMPDSVQLGSHVSAITLRELASHTSGLSRMPSNAPSEDGNCDNMKDYDVSDLYAYLSGLSDSDVGPKEFVYSNTGFGILGHIVVLVTGQSFDDAMRTLITGPLGMPDTSVELSSSQAQRMASPYAQGKPTCHLTFKDAFVGAGGLRSTITDMTTYARAAAGLGGDDTVVSAFQKMKVRIADDEFAQLRGQVGIAFQSFTSRGERVWWKDGVTPGYTCMLIVRSTDVVVMLTNSNAPGPYTAQPWAQKILGGSKPNYVPPKPNDWNVGNDLGYYSMPAGVTPSGPSPQTMLQVFRDTTVDPNMYPNALVLVNPAAQPQSTGMLPVQSACAWPYSFYLPNVVQQTDNAVEVYFIDDAGQKSLVLFQDGLDSYAVKVGSEEVAV